MRFLVLLPLLKHEPIERNTIRELSHLEKPDLHFDVRSIENGPASIESEFDDRLASPWVLDEVKRAETEGYDAVFVSCMGDVGINAARELVNIPVIGPFQACAAIAMTLGDRFSVVTILDNLKNIFLRKAREYGVGENLASVRSIDVPVLELDNRRPQVVSAIASESKKAVKEDGADSIILGCTGFVGLAREVQDKVGVPVLDPTPISVKLAELLVSSNLSHSRVAYHTPPKKLRKLPEMPHIGSKYIELDTRG